MKLTFFRLNVLIFFCIYLILTSLSIKNLNGGILTTESENFVYYYTDSRSFEKKIFEVYRTDWGAYQARELSYIFDFIDAQLIKSSIGLGFIHFYSFTHYFSVLVIAMLGIYISRKYFHIKSIIIPPLLSLLYITSPAVLLGSSFFRSAKILTALSLMVIIILLLVYASNNTKRKLIYSLLIIVSIAMSLFDRQGFFLCLALLAISITLWVLNKKRVYIKLISIFLSASIINIVYNYIIGPIIIHAVAAYPPSFEYQNFDYTQLIKQPQIFIQSTIYLFDIFSFNFGSLGRIFGIITCTFLIYIMIKPIKACKDNLLCNQKNIILITISSFIYLIILYAAMGLKHPPIFWDDLKRTYYPLVLYMLILVFTNAAIARMLILWPKAHDFIARFLIIISLLSIINLPFHYEVMKKGNANQFFIMSEYIKACIKNKQEPAEKFWPIEREITVCKAMRGEINY